MTNGTNGWVTMSAMAERLGVDHSLLRYHVKHGRITAQRQEIGTQLLWTDKQAQQIEKWWREYQALVHRGRWGDRGSRTE